MSLALSVKDAITEFAFEFYRTFLTRHPEKYKNLFYCPFILFSSLAALLVGAKGETKKELTRLLRLADFEKDRSVLEDLSYLTSALLKANKNYILYGNFLYVDVSVDCTATYIKMLRENFDMKPRRLDYRNEAIKSLRETINNDMVTSTEYAVDEVVTDELINNQINMLKVSAVFFRGYWSQEFHDVYKTGHEFSTLNGKVPVVMMFVKGIFNYYYSKECHCKILQLLYEACDLSMVVLLPDKPLSGIQAVEGLNGARFKKLLSKMTPRLIDVYLPKFAIGTEALPIKGTLEQMGAKSLFRGSKVDLQNLTDKPNCALDRLVHKAFAIVDDKGSFVSTMSLEVKQATKKSANLEFRANHPFAFFIMDEKTGTVVFMGFFDDPNLTLEVVTEQDIPEDELNQLINTVMSERA